MKKEEYVCVCHRVSLSKLRSHIQREKPKVASQLSECLDAGTSCGWCIPFLEKLHQQHDRGEALELIINHERYIELRNEYKQNKHKLKNSND
jgi:bacterioferritin-associated ferredoxin|tara:strand:- start:3921 stop:4196 length:276 start_codon:yes stop_codon:yes gene_type:complete